MRLARLMAGLALMLAAGPALAEDSSTIPGSKLTGPTFQRPMAQNPEMKPYISAAPKPATPAPAPVQAAAPPPAMPAAPTRSAALEDAGQLLQQAESDMAKHRLRAADTTLEQAETA